jgi:putative ABC transport system ATP-binding protein/macrolide transport system ATP-binding/permease protein/lipoprotein-releasing system ATP-binding protein
LRSDVQTVRDLGDGKYELTIYFWNVSWGKPIYVMSSGVQAYVQVGTAWQKVTLRPVDKMDGSVMEISGKQLYKFDFEARPEKFTELLPHYMHVRFVNNFVVSPSKMPKDDLFERKDNYYVYLKPWNATDSEILKDMKFPGAPHVDSDAAALN